MNIISNNRRRRCGSNGSSSVSSRGTLDNIYEEGEAETFTYKTRRHTMDQMPGKSSTYKRLKMGSIEQLRSRSSSTYSAPDADCGFIQRCASSVVITDELRRSFGLREQITMSPKAKSFDSVDAKKMTAHREILTPFEALSNFKRETPSYWISCSYTYRPRTKHIEMTIRQTGVFPEKSVINDGNSKLTLEVTLMIENSKKQKKQVVLRQCKKDTSFKSHKIDFSNISENDIRFVQARFRIFTTRWVIRKQISEWNVPLNDCLGKTKLHLNKVLFTE